MIGQHICSLKATSTSCCISGHFRRPALPRAHLQDLVVMLRWSKVSLATALFDDTIDTLLVEVGGWRSIWSALRKRNIWFWVASTLVYHTALYLVATIVDTVGIRATFTIWVLSAFMLGWMFTDQWRLDLNRQIHDRVASQAGATRAFHFNLVRQILLPRTDWRIFSMLVLAHAHSDGNFSWSNSLQVLIFLL